MLNREWPKGWPKIRRPRRQTYALEIWKYATGVSHFNVDSPSIYLCIKKAAKETNGEKFKSLSVFFGFVFEAGEDGSRRTARKTKKTKKILSVLKLKK